MRPILNTEAIKLQVEPLIESAFEAFGNIIAAPLPNTINAIPYPAPPSSSIANHNSALKYPNLIPLTSTFRFSPSGTPAIPRQTLFSCFPQHPSQSRETSHATLQIPVLERHPYTTQSFIPLSPVSSGCPRLKSARARYVIVVAPSLPVPAVTAGLTPYFPQPSIQQQIGQPGPLATGGKSAGMGMPDLQGLRAFIVEPSVHGALGITYGVGVWHAPMIVVGDQRVDFVVTQFMSGRDSEDCQEVLISGGGLSVQLELENGVESAQAKL